VAFQSSEMPQVVDPNENSNTRPLAALPSTAGFTARARVRDACRVQRLQRFRQSVVAPVQHVIVCQRARIDARSGQATNVLWVHPIIDTFVGPRRFSRGDGGLQVYDSKIDLGMIQFCQRITPDVIEAQWAWYRSMRSLGKSDVIARVANTRFV